MLLEGTTYSNIYLTSNVEHLLCFECVVVSEDMILKLQLLLSWVLKLRERERESEKQV